MSDHSILPPSSAGVWSKCPGSVLASMTFAETEEGEAAREGTAAHDVAADYITQTLGGHPSPEVEEAVKMYGDHVLEIATGGECIVGIEERLECSAIHADCFGTVDAYVYKHDERTLYVFDYKHGRGEVEVAGNDQLTAYASGILQKIPELESVIYTIVQPRAFHADGPIRSWETTRAELKQAANVLAEAAAEAMGPDPSTVSGGHCKYCRMRWACPAAIAAGSSLYEAVGSYVPHSIDGEDLGALYTVTTRALEHLKNMVAGMSSEIEARIRDGQPVGGYRLRPSAGRRVWAVSDADVIALGKFDKKDTSKTTVITPKQAEALGLEIPASYTSTPSKMKITETNAADVFGRK